MTPITPARSTISGASWTATIAGDSSSSGSGDERASCVLAHCGVFEDVPPQMAIVDPAELAYDRVFADHWIDVFRFALAWTNDWAVAEDLAQEAFLRLWDHRARL